MVSGGVFMENVIHKVVRKYGVLSVSENGWERQFNLVSWNGRPAKFDIRDWSPDESKMNKGLTLTEDEMKNLVELYIKE